MTVDGCGFSHSSDSSRGVVGTVLHSKLFPVLEVCLLAGRVYLQFLQGLWQGQLQGIFINERATRITEIKKQGLPSSKRHVR